MDWVTAKPAMSCSTCHPSMIRFPRLFGVALRSNEFSEASRNLRRDESGLATFLTEIHTNVDSSTRYQDVYGPMPLCFPEGRSTKGER